MKGDVCVSCLPSERRKTDKVIRKADGRTICLRCDSRSRARDTTAKTKCVGCELPKRKNTYSEKLGGWLCGGCARKVRLAKCADCEEEKPVEKRDGKNPICKNCLNERRRGICHGGCNSPEPKRLTYRMGSKHVCQACHRRRKREREERE
jgi:hypothetical protein